MLKSPRRVLSAAIALLTAIGCGGGEDGSGPTGSIQLSASPSALTVQQGGTGTVIVTLVRGGGFADPVNVTVTGLPTGVTLSVTPAQLTGQTTQAVVTVNVASTVPAGTYTATVTGTATGIGSTTVAYTLTVTALPTPSVSLSMTPATLTIEQGSSGQATLNAVRSNYTGNITPSVTGNPAGMTLTFNPNPLTANTSTVTVNVGGAVAVGQYNLTITGASGAAGNPTTTLQVSVTAPTGGSQFWEFCNTDDVPLKFWRQSGGTWTEVAPTVVGNVTRFSFTISSTSGGVAFTVSNTGGALRTSMRATRQRSVLRTFTRETRDKAHAAQLRLTSQNVALTTPFFDTFVLFALTSELSGFQETCDVTTPTLVSKTFNVSGQGGAEEGMLGYGGFGTALVPQTTSYDVMVEAGSYDWLAIFGPSPSFPDLTHNWGAYRIGRNEATPGGAVAINRVGATAFTTFPFTVTGGNAGSFFQFSQNLEGSRGQIIGFPIGSLLSETGNGNMLFLSPGDRLGTDLMSFSLSNTDLVGNNIDFRLSTRYIGSAPPASGNFALNAAVPPFTVTPVNGAPVPTWSVAGQTPSEYQTASSLIEASFTGNGENTLYTISATRAWLTANNFGTNYALTGPTLPGFLAQWAPGAPLVDSQVIMFGSNITTAPIVGSIINIAFRLQAP